MVSLPTRIFPHMLRNFRKDMKHLANWQRHLMTLNPQLRSMN